ncbi:MAG: hypothetical protein GY943_02755 [Chloroflexi bacterium]|nr:hypothetical protein [Chloroflexota bacterium]
MANVNIISSFDSPGRGPVGLTWDGRFLWNTDYTSSKIYRIDPETGEHDIELVCPGNLSGLGWDGRSLWQSLHDGGTLRRINPETNDFDQTIMVWEHGWLSGVTWDGEKLWTVSQQNGKLYALDHESGDVIKTIPAPLAAGGLAYHNGSLWLGYAYPMVFNEAYNHFDWEGDEQHFALLQINPENGDKIAQYKLDFLPMGLTWVNDELWMTELSARKIHRVQLM